MTWYGITGNLFSHIFFSTLAPTSMIPDWVLFLAYPNLFGIKCFVVVVAYLEKLTCIH
jgi:hypothetical protein